MSKRPNSAIDGSVEKSSTVLTTMTSDPSDGDFTVVPTREEKRKQRKMEKREQRKPEFKFVLDNFQYGKKIGIAHIRDLLLHIVADGQKPSWLHLQHRDVISRTVVLFLPGLLPEHFGIDPIPIAACMPFHTIPISSGSSSNKSVALPVIAELFSVGCPTRAPGDQRRLYSVVNTLLQSPLPDHVRRRKEEEGRKLAAVAKADASSPLLYLLTPNQMIDNDYQLPTYISPSNRRQIPGLDRSSFPSELVELLDGGYSHKGDDTDFGMIPDSYIMPTSSIDGKDLRLGKKEDDTEWVQTEKTTSPPEGGLYPVLALDCEMVLTEDGQILARVSVIDYQSGVNIFDELVKPAKPVLDYLTQWSGITSEQLSSAKHTLSSVQRALVTGPSPLITPHTILLGHSLECDLSALKIRHPLCIDTALIYKHPRGPPYKPGLKWLAQKWLGKEIQASVNGHDSEEDARACVDLLKMKMANGPEFGTFLDTTESVFERMGRYVADMKTKQTKTTACCDYGNPRGGHGLKAKSVSKCTNDEEVLDAMMGYAKDHDFVFGRMTELANAQGWNVKANPDPSKNADAVDEDLPSLDSALSNTNDRIRRLHDSLPNNSAFICLTGHSNPVPMLKLTARRQKWERLTKLVGGVDDIPREERWLSEDDRELETRVAQAREGMAFFCVKRSR